MAHLGKSEAGYEHQDLRAKVVYGSLIGLAVAVLVVHLAFSGLYGFVDHYVKTHQPPPNPMAQASTEDMRYPKHNDVMKFPEPRLEENERLEIKDYRVGEEQQLNSYGWVNQSAGSAHIPIDRAKELIVQRGLPTTPQMGNAPFSVVEMAKQAAMKSDHSEGSPKDAAPQAQPKTGRPGSNAAATQ